MSMPSRTGWIAHLNACVGPLEIVISDERDHTLPLETGGGIKAAAAHLGEAPILVANIDSVWIEDDEPPATAIRDLCAGFDPERMSCRLLLAHMARTTGFDGVGRLHSGRRRAADARRTAGLPSAPLNYMGVHIVDPRPIYAWPETGVRPVPGGRRPVGRLGGARAAARPRHGRRLDACRRSRSPRRRRGAPRLPLVWSEMTGRFDPFAGAGPRWLNIPAHRPFLEDLAAGVLDWLGDAPPETLSDAVILLPNRRAARAFGAALSRLSGDKPILLPQVRPLGDLEEDEPPFAPGEIGLDLPPAIAPLTRRFEMARMIAEDLKGEFEDSLSPLRALELADAFGGFLDSCQIEEIIGPVEGRDPGPRRSGRALADVREIPRTGDQGLARPAGDHGADGPG
jgi:hypothetical protein